MSKDRFSDRFKTRRDRCRVSRRSFVGRSLGLELVAEGIERADQLQRLLELRCEMGQGFFFAKPLPPDELATLLEERVAMHGEAEALARGRQL